MMAFRVPPETAHSSPTAVLLCGVLASVTGEARADTESVSFGVENYGYDGYCTGTPLTWPVQDAQAFYATTRDYNLFSSNYVWTQLGVDWEDIVEGEDDEVAAYGIDHADIAFFSGHGLAANCPGSGSKYGYIKAGDPGPSGLTYGCLIRIGSSSTSVVLAEGGADSDVNYLMMHSSKTLEFCASDAGNTIYWVDGGNSGPQLTLMNGFHNSPADEQENAGELVDYLIHADVDGVGDDWIDILNNRYGVVEECPVSIVVAPNETAALNHYNNGGINDWTDTGSHSGNFYFVDCGNSECSSHPWC